VQVLDHFLFAQVLVLVAFVERLRHFSRGSTAIAEREQFPIQLTQAAERVRLRHFDDEAGFPGKRLLADFQVGAQLGTPKALLAPLGMRPTLALQERGAKQRCRLTGQSFLIFLPL